MTTPLALRAGRRSLGEQQGAGMTDHVSTHQADDDIRNESILIYVNGRIVPKDDLSVRQATQLNLLDSIILTSIIHECGDLIEQRRRATSENRIFSYRFKPDNDGWLYDRNFDWTPFWTNCYDNSKQYSYALVLDISDFYNQIYHHTIENQLIESGLPNQYTKWIVKLLESLTAKVSRGIPVGPHATHLLAEATLIPVDNSLVLQGINFCRFVDDFVIFANSEDEARAYLYRTHLVS